MKEATKFGSWLAAAIIAPFVVMSVELLLTRNSNILAPGSDIIGLGLAIIAGLCCLWQLPTNVRKRALLTVVFVPIAVATLVFYSLVFVCIVFGDCL
jgi:hypothetical protein